MVVSCRWINWARTSTCDPKRTFVPRHSADSLAIVDRIASKDGSVATLTDSRFEDVAHAAFMAYVKKSEYGPARLVVERIRLVRVGQKAAPVGASTVEVDGWLAPRVELDVGRLYRTGYMAK